MNRSNEIKGLPGVSLPELYSGSPFYILSGKLTGVGCVITLPDDKQGRSPHQ